MLMARRGIIGLGWAGVVGGFDWSLGRGNEGGWREEDEEEEEEVEVEVERVRRTPSASWEGKREEMKRTRFARIEG